MTIIARRGGEVWMIYTNELVRRVAMGTRLNQKFVSEVLQEFLNQIQGELKRGERVQLTGFGTFYTRQRPKSQVRNFQTEETMTVPAMRVPAFRPGEPLKKAVRRGRKANAAEVADWLTPKVADEEEEPGRRRGRRGAEEI